MVLVKNWQFFHVFIFGKIGQENVCHDILERKNVFLDDENKKLKKLKIFPKELVHGFGQKLSVFLCLFVFFLATIGQENVSRYSRKKKRLSRV